MNRKQVTSTLAAAALAGLFAGTLAYTTGCTSSDSGSADHSTVGASHDCKGKNSCKGTGGCKTGDQGCKGKNSCKGQGGCKA